MITLLRWLRPIQALAVLTLLLTGLHLARAHRPLAPSTRLKASASGRSLAATAALQDSSGGRSPRAFKPSGRRSSSAKSKSSVAMKSGTGPSSRSSAKTPVGSSAPSSAESGAESLSELDEIARAANLMARNTGLLTARPTRRTLELTCWAEVIETFSGNRLIHRGSYGELKELVALSERLQRYRALTLKSKGSRREFLAMLGWNHGDMRRLAAFLHWYLCTAWRHCRDREAELPGRLTIELWPHELKPLPETRVKALRGLDHETLLGLLD